jgi:transposase
MSQSEPLTEAERERIYQGLLQGKTQVEVAIELGRSIHVVRKWWRRIREKGAQGLRNRKRGPKAKGILSRFEPRVAQTALRLKRSHPRWGADRVLTQLKQDPRFEGVDLPDRSRLAVLFKEECPECVAKHQPRAPAPSAPPQATAAHEVWQLDNQEKVVLQDGEIAVICNVRDPVGAAMIASRAFAAKTVKHWRKLAWEEYRQVLREAFAEWQTLPDSLLTDNELVLAGSPRDPFPSKLTLWLRGLGVKHIRIRPHCPTDQPQVERNHRTLNNFTLSEDSRANVACLQQALDQERRTYNYHFPSRASDCAGSPPLTAHPELLQPRRLYRPEFELVLFDLQRVFDYLAEFTFERRVSATGVVSLGRRLYSIGRCYAGKTVQVRCDPLKHEWVCSEKVVENDREVELELVRRPVKGVDVQTLTGLKPQPLILEHPLQLTLPFLAP